MRISTRRPLLLLLALNLAACSVAPFTAGFPPGQPCTAADFTIIDDFPGANRGECSVIGPNRVRLDLSPENPPPINDSPWFAFRIEPRRPGTAEIHLRYHDGHHRYVPKVSYDRISWQPLRESTVTAARQRQEAGFTLKLDGRPLFVSAQPLVTQTDYDDWITGISNQGVAKDLPFGQSRDGRAMRYLDTGPGVRDVLLLVARQHPTEVTGVPAFLTFSETVLADTELARRFRERFRVVMVPVMNPDGVERGHWRNNVGGVDLNRDWGPFTQPETQAIKRLLDALDAEGGRVRFFLDFHSTNRNVFFTQNDDFPTDPPGLMDRWLDSVKPKLNGYDFDNDRNSVSEQATAKNYMYRRYGVPTATYEVGDETDLLAAELAARVFAQELMTLLLQQRFEGSTTAASATSQ